MASWASVLSPLLISVQRRSKLQAPTKYECQTSGGMYFSAMWSPCLPISSYSSPTLTCWVVLLGQAQIRERIVIHAQGTAANGHHASRGAVMTGDGVMQSRYEKETGLREFPVARTRGLPFYGLCHYVSVVPDEQLHTSSGSTPPRSSVACCGTWPSHATPPPAPHHLPAARVHRPPAALARHRWLRKAGPDPCDCSAGRAIVG